MVNNILKNSLYFLLFASINIYAQNTVALIEGQKEVFDSKILNEKRKYTVVLPESYHKLNSKDKKYPLLILLDGNIHIKPVSGLLQFMSSGYNGNFQVPEMIILAVSNVDRERDFTPTKIETVRKNNSGGGENFLAFLEKEFIPFIDKNFRTAPFRLLIGHSLGGLITTHSYMKKEKEFNAFIAIDPSYWWGKDILIQKVNAIHKKSFRNSLYIASANNFTSNKTKMKHELFFKELKAKANENINVSYKYYPEEDHNSVPLKAIYDGLLFTFKGYKFNYRADYKYKDIVNNYKELSVRLSFQIKPPERLVNKLGYRNIFSKNPDRKALALNLFKLNARNFPGSSNAYDSLGEAYKILGDKEKAIKNYRKSLELNPKNFNAEKEINKLTSK